MAHKLDVDCRHYSLCGVAGGGCCALGFAKGRPTETICLNNLCRKRVPNPRTPPSRREAVPLTIPANKQPKLDGPAKWGELHRYAGSYTGDAKAARAWLGVFSASLGNFDCSCKDHWRHILAANPPDLSSRAAFFQWTVKMHNLVNQRLGKPQFSYEDARRKYNYSDEVNP